MSFDYINEMSETNRTMTWTADKLRSIANKVRYSHGETQLVDDLEECAEALACQAEIFEKVWTDDNHQRFRQAQESTGNLLKAVMAGCIVNKDGGVDQETAQKIVDSKISI